MPKFKHRITQEAVDAIKFVDDNGVMAFVNASSMHPPTSTRRLYRLIAKPTETRHEQVLLVKRGNWVVRYEDGSLSVWMADSFKDQFEEVSAPVFGDGNVGTLPLANRQAADQLAGVLVYRTQRFPLNLWDSFNPREFLASANRGSTVRGDHSITLRLFGNRNVGLNMRTNLLMAGQVPRDESYVITNWYARTNMHALPAEFHAFASSAVVTLVVGEKSQHAAPLDALLSGRSRYYEMQADEPGISDALAQEELAQHVYVEALPSAAKACPWHKLPPSEQDHWRSVSRIASSFCAPAVLAQIPERQIYSVSVSVDRRALGRLLEVLPTDIAPESLIWIHLEGVRRV